MKSVSTVIAWRPRLCRPVLAAVCLAAATFGSAPARGGLIISAQSVSAAAGSSANVLDVTLENTGASAVTIGGFAFEITAASSAIDFTAANISTSAPYIFTGDSLLGPTISTSTGQTLDASDVSASGLGTSVASGATLGLGHLLFDVSNSASGIIDVTLAAFPVTNLSDQNGNNVSISSLDNGTVTIKTSTVVPAASTLVMSSILLGMFGMVWSYKWLRQISAVARNK